MASANPIESPHDGAEFLSAGEAEAPFLDDDGDLSLDILNIMEQGIILWDENGRCSIHNNRVFRVLELSGGDVVEGCLIDDFFERALQRKELSRDILGYYEGQVSARQPYTFDLKMPSGRVILTNGRPTRGGGYVVTFTDVTMARRASEELTIAKLEAEEARLKAEEILAQERARQREAGFISGLDEWLQSCKSLSELFAIVETFMLKLLPGSAGELYIFSNSRDVLDGVAAWGDTKALAHITSDSCWSLRRGRHYEYTKDGLCMACDHVLEAIGEETVPEHYVCVPVIAHGDTVGLLHFGFDHLANAVHGVSPGAFAVRCAEHISMAIANVKLRDELRDQSIRDPLTGLFNRRHFMETIRTEIGRSRRDGKGFAVVSIDADHFKAFNDNHGHDAGDMVLRRIGDAIRDQLSDRETGCRMGGEEFAILVPDVNVEGATNLAERLRDSIGGAQVRYLDKVLPGITISAGVAVYPDDGEDAATLLRRADKALYAAKDGGRNQVQVASND